MRIVDANVLLYAVNEDEPRHDEARQWLDDALSGDEVVGFAWVVLLAFVRLVTKPGLFPSPRHVEVLSTLLSRVGSGANLVNYAHLAPLAAEHDAVIVTYDADFARLAGARVERPGT